MNKSDAMRTIENIISLLETNVNPFSAGLLKIAIDVLISGDDLKDGIEGDKIFELTKAINRLIGRNPAVKEKMYQVEVSKVTHRVGICKAVTSSKARYIGLKACGKIKAVKFWDVKVKRIPLYDLLIDKIEPNKLYAIEFIREKAKDEIDTKTGKES